MRQFILDEIFKPIVFTAFWIAVGFIWCLCIIADEIWDLDVTIHTQPTQESCIELFSNLTQID